MSKVRVKRKGQVTIPSYLRRKLRIDEGTVLEVAEHVEGVLLRPLPPPEPGEVVGEAEHKRLIEELDKLRGRWR